MLGRIRSAQARGHEPTHEELVDVWCDSAGIDVSLPADPDGTRRSDGPDGRASLAAEILGGRGLVAPNLIGFATGQGAIYRDPARRHLSMIATPIGLAEFAEARLRELEVEPEDGVRAEPTSWIARLRVALARRGPQYDEDGRRRWTIEDLVNEVGVHRSTLARNRTAVELLRVARTAQTWTRHAESEGDHLVDDDSRHSRDT